jgi:hypothetical protein
VTPTPGLVVSELPSHGDNRSRFKEKAYSDALHFEFAERVDIDLVFAGRWRGDHTIGNASVHTAVDAGLAGVSTVCFATATGPASPWPTQRRLRLTLVRTIPAVADRSSCRRPQRERTCDRD